MLRPQPEKPENPRDERTRVFRLAHHVVEPAGNRGAPIVRGRCWRDDGNQHALAEVRLGAHAGRQHGDRVHLAKRHDYHFNRRDELVGRPFGCLGDVEPDPFKRLSIQPLRAAVDDEY